MMQPTVLARKLLWVVLIITLCAAFFPTIWNVDIFWHVATGNWILEHYEIPSKDIFSAISPDREWIPFQWLYEVLAAVVYKLSGLGGLRLISGLLLIGALWLLVNRLKERHANEWVVLTLTALTFVLFGDRIRVRPHLFNFLFVIFYASLLLEGTKDQSLSVTLKRVVPGVALWANLHAGGALIFLVLLASIPGGAFLDYILHRKRNTEANKKYLKNSVLLWCGAALTASLMPNFVTGAYHSIFMLDASQHLISEWKPAWSWVSLFMTHGHPSMLIVGTAPWALLLVSLLMPLLDRNKRDEERWSAGQWLLAVGVSLIAIKYGRFAWLCFLPASLIAMQFNRKQRYRPVWAVIAASLTFAVFNYQVVVLKGGLEHLVPSLTSHIDTRRFPVEAARFLNTAQITGRAWTLPNWGGFVTLLSDGDIKVLADGRGNYTREVADDVDHIYRNRWKTEAVSKTQAAYNRYKELDLIIMQTPALPNNEGMPGWIQIYPINSNWSDEFGFPPQASVPRKEIVYARTEATETIGKAKELWKEVGLRIRSTQRIDGISTDD